MTDRQTHNSLLRLHDKVDNIMGEISDLKVSVAIQPCKSHNIRVRALEAVTYGAVGLILIAFMASLSGDSTTKANANNVKKNVPIVKKVTP